MRKYIFLTVLAFAIGTFDAFSQSQNMRFKEVVRQIAAHRDPTLTYTVPQGHVLKITSYSFLGDGGVNPAYHGEIFINQVKIKYYREYGGSMPHSSVRCEIWLNEGDVLELRGYSSSNPQYWYERFWSGILYELY